MTQVDARKQFAASVQAEPARTDILGALDAARQELASLPKGDRHRLIVESDFIEDGGVYRFLSSSALTDENRAQKLAVRLRAPYPFTLQVVVPASHGAKAWNLLRSHRRGK